MTNKNTLDRKEAAAWLGVSVITVDRAVANGTITHVRIGRRILFTEENLNDFLQSKTISKKVGLAEEGSK